MTDPSIDDPAFIDDDFAPLEQRIGSVLESMGDADPDAASVTAALARHRIGDGLPLIAPTADRVKTLLAGRDPGETAVSQPIPLSFVLPTWWDLAACAVMAGCVVDPDSDPARDLLGVMAGALDAAAEPDLNLLGVQTTTGAAALLVLVHGPVVDSLDLHVRSNALGPGLSLNAALGRAIQLVLVHVGLARPGEGDMATHGHPGKFSWCAAERQTASPWSPLSASRGLAPDASAVTVAAGVGNLEVVLSTDGTDALVNDLAGVIRAITRTGAVVLLPPDAANHLDAQGWGRDDLLDALEASCGIRPLVMVTGGAGVKSTVIPYWGGSTTAATRPVPLPEA